MFRVSLRIPLPFVIAMVMSGLVWAHSTSELAKRPPPHGGMLAAMGAYDVELVLKPDRVQVFVTDHLYKPVPAKGFKGTATLRVKGQKTLHVPLQVVDDRLEGAAAIPAGVPVTVLIRLNTHGTDQMLPFAWPAGGPKARRWDGKTQ